MVIVAGLAVLLLLLALPLAGLLFTPENPNAAGPKELKVLVWLQPQPFCC